ncbi:MAG: LysM peptidoglycan-binding domain-containing protein [Bacteroidales bacterium]
MKKVSIILLLFSITCLVFPESTHAQKDSSEVQRSEDKVKIGGELYYIHIVEKGQTLFSISRAYDVSQKAIAKENPDILIGLRAGQALKIPYNPSEEDRVQHRDTINYNYHTVSKGETLFSLSRQYDVPVDKIKEENPAIKKESLKTDQVIKIPKKRQVEEITEQPEDTIDTLKGEEQIKGDYISHRIKKDETLYSISRKYNVEIKDIKEANKGIRQDDLELGSVIRIPGKKDQEDVSGLFADIFDTTESKPDTTSLTYFARKEKKDECEEDNFYRRRGINVDIFLPFHTEKHFEETYIDSSEVNEEGDTLFEEIKRDPDYIYSGAKNFLEFYEGIILSLDSLKESGVEINLRVFDTKNNTRRVRKILRENEFRETDLIIGPIYRKNFQLVSEFANKEKIDIVSPFARNKSWLKDHNNLIQIYPSKEAQLERFASHIAKFSDKNMVLVHSGDSLYYPETEKFKQLVFSHISRDTSLIDIRLKEVAFSKDSLLYLEQAMNHDEENIVVVPTNDEAFVTSVLTNLNTLYKKDYKIKVFGFSDWKDFENIDQEYLYNLKLNLFTPFYVNYEDESVKGVIRKYRSLFKSEPSKYVFHGFDIGYYFFNTMYTYGKNYKDCMLFSTPELCQSEYQFFRHSDDEGIENIAITILQYNQDFTIDELKIDLPVKKEQQEYGQSFPSGVFQ